MSLYDFIGRFILFVIPGFVTCSIFSYLSDNNINANVTSAFYVFICSGISCILANILMWIVNKVAGINYTPILLVEILSGDRSSLTSKNLVYATICSVGLGFLISYLFEEEFVFKLGRKLNITHKNSNGDVWDSLFADESWVIVRDYVSENVYYGQVARYSDKGNIREILLKDVSVFSKKDGDYHMEQVYLARCSSEFSLEIDDYEKEKENAKEEYEYQIIEEYGNYISYK